jgi:hypothetical protein
MPAVGVAYQKESAAMTDDTQRLDDQEPDVNEGGLIDVEETARLARDDDRATGQAVLDLPHEDWGA